MDAIEDASGFEEDFTVLEAKDGQSHRPELAIADDVTRWGSKVRCAVRLDDETGLFENVPRLEHPRELRDVEGVGVHEQLAWRERHEARIDMHGGATTELQRVSPVRVSEVPPSRWSSTERLDSFGRTVNIAARVRGIAGAGEIVCTEPVYEVPGGREIVAAAGLSVERASAPLKGIAGEVPVVRLYRTAGAEHA
ncbi:hypothetical protein QHF83_48670 [Polyangium sp. 15x6]|nr:hypothetical protein [Polyangium sp. 15x6]MDI3291279.1 hypothetical protein [Polyangium sp. 15x6]